MKFARDFAKGFRQNFPFFENYFNYDGVILVKIVLKHLESRYNFIAKILRRKICLNDLSIEILKAILKF